MAETPKFEEGLEQLEKLAEELEGGELDLDEALKRFEKGVKLSKQLNQSLEEATRRVEKLVADKDGGVTTEDFDEPGGAEKPSKAKKGKAGQDTLF